MAACSPPTQSSNPLHPSILPHLDPAFIKLYNEHISNLPPASIDLNLLRQIYAHQCSFAAAPLPQIGGIGETTVPGWDKYPGEVHVRVYIPPGEVGERRVWPVHFNFHGGGWVSGDLSTDQHICHHISVSTPCTVIDIAYRLIPEYPFPIGIMDALVAVKYILFNYKTFSIDPSRVTFGGISAGARIALILNHLAADHGFGGSVKGVVAGTPTINDLDKWATAHESPYQSMHEMEFAPTLDWTKLKWFDALRQMSLSAADRNGREAVSWFGDIMAAPNFQGLAPIWIGTAECDPLRDEAEAYAEKVKEHENQVICRRFPGVPHSFMHMNRALEQGQQFIEDIVAHVKRSLYP